MGPEYFERAVPHPSYNLPLPNVTPQLQPSAVRVPSNQSDPRSDNGQTGKNNQGRRWDERLVSHTVGEFCGSEHRPGKKHTIGKSVRLSVEHTVSHSNTHTCMCPRRYCCLSSVRVWIPGTMCSVVCVCVCVPSCTSVGGDSVPSVWRTSLALHSGGLGVCGLFLGSEPGFSQPQCTAARLVLYGQSAHCVCVCVCVCVSPRPLARQCHRINRLLLQCVMAIQ